MGEMKDCVGSSRQNNIVIAVFENPYKVDPPLDCYSYNSYTKIKLVYDPGFMTCFYKGKNCPESDYAPEVPGAWVKGIRSSSVARLENEHPEFIECLIDVESVLIDEDELLEDLILCLVAAVHTKYNGATP
ncbi:uncharacterized protein LOC142350485 [Convolutriloba macropyga]|uniref:uncharacterized protein LOC142350485 n=1 Tax=Convolutriloba macropyga TaxID=536237 RepID=UPI003F525429